MRDCNCQEHQPDQSIYCMLSLNETASDAELMHAYEEEMALLNGMQPTSAAEQKLLEAKQQALRCAMERAGEETLSQRVRNQYQKRQAHAVRLHSFFPVGFLGLILRLTNSVIGTDGLIDRLLHRVFDWLDRECCGCSCCYDNECILDDVYGCLFSNGLCECPSNCAECYERSSTFRLIDMGIAIAMAVGTVICFLKMRAEDAALKVRRRKQLSVARDNLRELKTQLRRRDEMTARFIGMYDRLKLFSLDVRPVVRFLAELPGATTKFISMADRISEPGSFYDQIQSEVAEAEELHRQITAIDENVVRLADAIQKNETFQELDADEPCGVYLNQALHGLTRNRKYQEAVGFFEQNM